MAKTHPVILLDIERSTALEALARLKNLNKLDKYPPFARAWSEASVSVNTTIEGATQEIARLEEQLLAAKARLQDLENSRHEQRREFAKKFQADSMPMQTQLEARTTELDRQIAKILQDMPPPTERDIPFLLSLFGDDPEFGQPEAYLIYRIPSDADVYLIRSKLMPEIGILVLSKETSTKYTLYVDIPNGIHSEGAAFSLFCTCCYHENDLRDSILESAQKQCAEIGVTTLFTRKWWSESHGVGVCDAGEFREVVEQRYGKDFVARAMRWGYVR